MKKKKAFTLIELLVVVGILALLVAVAVPKYRDSQKKAAQVTHQSNVRLIKTMAQQELANGGDPTNLAAYIEDASLLQVPKILNIGSTYSVTLKDGEIIVSPEASATPAP